VLLGVYKETSRLASAARLENLLVNKYWTIVDERVYGSVRKGLKDFEDFVTHVRRFLESGEKMHKAGFRYHKLTVEEKERLLDGLRKELQGVDDIVFAYVHGGFIETEVFRDVDVAVWIKNPKDAFGFEVDISAKLQAKFKIPIDLRVINQAPLPFKHRTYVRGKLLFSKNEALRIREIDETVRRYADLDMLRKCTG